MLKLQVKIVQRFHLQGNNLELLRGTQSRSTAVSVCLELWSSLTLTSIFKAI